MLTFLIMSGNEYFPQFKILYKSIRKFHPDDRILLRPFENIKYKIPDDVEVSPLPSYCNVVCRERPNAILKEIKNNHTVCFIDADAELFGKIEPPPGNVVLVPHFVKPIPIDEFWPALSEHGHVGLYNCGFQFIRPSTESVRAYTWLSEVFEQHCFTDAECHCMDQSWTMHLPCFFDGVTIWQTQCVNCATYNCNEYNFRLEDGIYRTDEGPIKMFHYCGYRFSDPNNLSSYMTRYPVMKDDLKEFMLSYHRRATDPGLLT